MDSMKRGVCLNCKTKFEMPINECMAQCSDCKECIVFLCHVQKLDEKNPVKFLKMICSQCKKIHTLMTCPSCMGTLAIKEFIAGLPYSCRCGFTSTLIVCNKCFKILCLPAQKNYQNTPIDCKNCKHGFSYVMCEVCQAMIFKDKNNREVNYVCPNSECPKSQIDKRLSQRVSRFYDQTQEVANQKKETANQQELCKVCLDKSAQMINLTCFHLSVCEKCSSQLKNVCPICRSKGQYKKVYKA